MDNQRLFFFLGFLELTLVILEKQKKKKKKAFMLIDHISIVHFF